MTLYNQLKSAETITCLIDNETGEKMCNDKIISDVANSHYSNIGKLLAAKKKKDLWVENDFLKHHLKNDQQSFSFDAITPGEVADLIKGVKLSKPSGIEKIPIKLFKDASQVLVPEITFLFNPMDPNPAISARMVFPQSGHTRLEKRPFFQNFPHFSKIEAYKKYEPLIGVQYIILKPTKRSI